jgi:hypothetical protein
MRALRWFTGTRYAVEYLDALLARTISDKPAEQRREQLLRVLFEWCAQGPAAAVHEANLLSEDWGIDFASIAMPVQAWHGVEDARAPIRAIRWMLERMPNSSRSELPGEHFDIHKNLTRCLKPWWRSTRRVSLGHSLARRLHSDAVLIHVPQLQQGGSYMATLFYCVEWGTTDLDLDLQHS